MVENLTSWHFSAEHQSCGIRFFVFLVACGLAPALVCGQQVATDPSSTHIFPAGGRRGTEVKVQVGGECIPPGTRFRIWGEGLTAPSELGARVTGNYVPSPRRKPSEQPVTHPTEWASHITIAADASLSPGLWRLSCARGGTGGRPFIIGDLPELSESESNSEPADAQQVELPITINGQIAGECDLDYFSFSAHVGDVVNVDTVAARLGSALDPVVQIFDPAGHRIAAQELRVGADPVLAFRADVTGEYQLLISSVTFRGGPAFVYRVTVSTTPFLRFAYPAGGQTGRTETINFFSLSGDGHFLPQPHTVSFSGPTGPFWTRLGDSSNPIPLLTGNLPEANESTNNNQRESATELRLPQVMNGQLESSTDEDWYRLACRGGTSLSIECLAQPGWSAALPLVTLVDAQGSLVSAANAIQAVDGTTRILWQPPTDGEWWLRVRDLQHGIRGGPDFIYRLTVQEAVPDFLLSSKVDVINVVQGARVEVDIAIQNVGSFSGPIELIAEGIPEGVTVEGTQIAAGQTSAKLAFVATEEARSCDVMLRIRGKAEIAGATIERPVRAMHLGHDPDGIGIESSSVNHVQLTIVHKPVFRLYCNEAYQYAHRGTVYPYLMEVERLNGFDQPIHLEVADRQIKDLDGIDIPATTIASDQSKFMLPLYLPETMHINVQAHSNVYAQGHVAFVDKFGQRQTMLVVSTMRCMIRTLPTVVRLRCLNRELPATTKSRVMCSLVLDRTPNFLGPMQIQLLDPPLGISAEAITIAAGETTADAAIEVEKSMTLASSIPLRFRAVGLMDGDVQVVSEAPVTLVLPAGAALDEHQELLPN